jgi:CelD/BcsL family acetyltransferase involved in cellulose biosynthesis
LFSAHSDQFGGLLSVLYAGGTPVAAHFGLRSGHMLAQWFPAYDTRFSRQSPGLIQQLRMAEETADLGIHMINLGKGTERYKKTLKNHDLLVAEGVAAGAPLSAAAHRVRISAVKWIGPRIRKHPYLFRAADRLLRHYGRTT